MPIEPERKDWTWVLREPCPDCRLDVSRLDPAQTGALTRGLVPRWNAVLQRPGATTRPDDDTWSPTEYACHVRDVFRLFDHRLELMLTHDDPLFANWDQDASAVADRYDLQDPATVAGELAAAAAMVADRFDGVGETQWQRPGRRSDGTAFTVASFARYFLHDPVHHLWDVGG